MFFLNSSLLKVYFCFFVSTLITLFILTILRLLMPNELINIGNIEYLNQIRYLWSYTVISFSVFYCHPRNKDIFLLNPLINIFCFFLFTHGFQSVFSFYFEMSNMQYASAIIQKINSWTAVFVSICIPFTFVVTAKILQYQQKCINKIKSELNQYD